MKHKSRLPLRFTLLFASICVAALSAKARSAPIQTPAQKHSERWILKVINKSDSLPVANRDWNLLHLPREGYRQAEGACKHYLQKYGDNAVVLNALAHCQNMLGRFKATVDTRTHLTNLKNTRSSRDALALAKRQIQIAQAVLKFLPAKEEILQVSQVILDGKPLWLVFSGYCYGWDGLAERRLLTRDHCLTLLQDKPIRKVWQKLIKTKYTDDGRLYVADINGDGQKEWIVWSLHHNSGGENDWLIIYTWRKHRPVEIFHSQPMLWMWMEDLNHDGKLEIRGSKEIGVKMCHGGQPRWPTYYELHRGYYREASQKFPEEYLGWNSRLHETLDSFPCDWDILCHLGILHEIHRQPGKAMSAYRLAKKYFVGEWSEAQALDARITRLQNKQGR